jgi:hypothetical protein
MEAPFTNEEKEVWDLLSKAHAGFLKLPVTHSSDGGDWCNAIHRLQDLISLRVLRREFPKTFQSTK